MPESITVSATGGGYDNKGNPLPTGTPVTIPTLGIAPGNTAQEFSTGGDLDSVEFTVYLELDSPINDNDLITVRGKECRARVQEWRSPYTNRGGLVVLAESVTGTERS